MYSIIQDMQAPLFEAVETRLEELDLRLRSHHSSLDNEDPWLSKSIARVEQHHIGLLSDLLLGDMEHFPTKELRLRLGRNAVSAARFLTDSYDFSRAHFRTLEPPGTYTLSKRKTIRRRTHEESLLGGRLYYFSFATIGRTLSEGGDLSIVDKPNF
jgi:hypothetical protein